MKSIKRVAGYNKILIDKSKELIHIYSKGDETDCGIYIIGSGMWLIGSSEGINCKKCIKLNKEMKK